MVVVNGFNDNKDTMNMIKWLSHIYDNDNDSNDNDNDNEWNIVMNMVIICKHIKHVNVTIF